jgi:hypothetical protein
MDKTQEQKQREFADLIFKVAEKPMVNWIAGFLDMADADKNAMFPNVEEPEGIRYEIKDPIDDSAKIIEIGIHIMTSTEFNLYKDSLIGVPNNLQLAHCREFLSYALRVVHSSIMGSMKNEDYKQRLSDLDFTLDTNNFWNTTFCPLNLRKLKYLKGVKETHDKNTDEELLVKKLQDLKEPCKIEVISTETDMKTIEDSKIEKEYGDLCEEILRLELVLKGQDYETVIKENNSRLEKEPKFFITLKTFDKQEFIQNHNKLSLKKIDGDSAFDNDFKLE